MSESDENLPEEELVDVSLSSINPEKPLPGDVFVKVNEKFIRFKYKGDAISVEKYNLFLNKNVSKIYVEPKDASAFADWVQEVRQNEIDEVVAVAGEEARPIVEANKEIEEAVYEVFAPETITSSQLDLLQGQVEKFVEAASQNPEVAVAMAHLDKFKKSLAQHSTAVANLSLFLGTLLGKRHQYILENLYKGGLFHDYGKTKIDPNILEDPAHPKYVTSLQRHPGLGKKILAKMDAIQEPVLQIIEQHHECFNGTGYPQGLFGGQIYELTRIVSIANGIHNTIENFMGPKKQGLTKAIKVVEFDKGKSFDPEIAKLILPGLKKASKLFGLMEGEK